MSSPKKLPKILAIVGPTASGKSALAIKLARKFGGEIVSADSRQIYRGMDVGTAKPLRDKIFNFQFSIFKNDGLPHHLFDIKNPDEEYTVVEYKRDAIRAIRNILRRGKLPILAGGTGLYVKAVVDNLDIPKVKANATLRKNLELRIKNNGLEHLVEELLRLDPEAAYIVDLKNPRRVIRALEVAIQTGKPFTAQQKRGKPLFDALQIGINLPPAELKKRIYKRVDEMLAAGLVEEVKNLVEKYPSTSLNSARDKSLGANGLPRAFDAIGYREIINYLNGEITLEMAAEQIKQNTWKYAKRQMTWFRKDKRILWLDNIEKSFASVRKFLFN